MAASVCRVTYFNFRALAEPIRLLLAYGGIPFEDIRLDRYGSQWEELKPSYPLGQLPLLEIDGISIHQSKAICRYVGRKTGLNGNNDKEAAEIDIVTDVCYDLIMKMRTLREINNPEAHESKFQEFKTTAIPFYLQNLNKIAKTNNGFLACKKLTWADFYFAGAADYISHLCRCNILEGNENLKDVVHKVLSLPELKKYLASRPENDF